MGNVGTLLQLLDFQSFNATTKVSDWRECCCYLEGEQGLSDGVGERDPAIVHQRDPAYTPALGDTQTHTHTQSHTHHNHMQTFAGIRFWLKPWTIL